MGKVTQAICFKKLASDCDAHLNLRITGITPELQECQVTFGTTRSCQDRRSGINLRKLLILKLYWNQNHWYRGSLESSHHCSVQPPSPSFQDWMWRNFFCKIKVLLSNVQGGDYEIMILIKISLPIWPYHRTFFFFFFSWQLEMFQKAFRSRKLRTFALWAGFYVFPGLMYLGWDIMLLTTLHWQNLWASKSRLSSRLLGSKSQSKATEYYILFFNYTEWQRTCHFLSWVRREKSFDNLCFQCIKEHLRYSEEKNTSLEF